MADEIRRKFSIDQAWRHRNLLFNGINPRTGERFPGLPTLEDWLRDFPDDAGVLPEDEEEIVEQSFDFDGHGRVIRVKIKEEK